MADTITKHRLGKSGRAAFSPLGYYRLGQSYPRDCHRMTYPRLRRHMFFGTVGIVFIYAKPGQVVATQTIRKIVSVQIQTKIATVQKLNQIAEI